MRRNKMKIRKLKYYNIIHSTSCGTLLAAALTILFGYAGSRSDFPAVLISVMLSLSLAAGGTLSGYVYGKRKRHNGIKNGIICGAIIYAVIFIFGIFYLGALPPFRLIRYLFLLCVSGAVGGIIGVNSKIKLPPV